jgi:hypothetical protein
MIMVESRAPNVPLQPRRITTQSADGCKRLLDRSRDFDACQ